VGRIDSVAGKATYLATMACATATIAAGIWAGGPADRAEAAPCPPPSHVLGAGILQISGDPGCRDSGETFIVYCTGGTIKYFYAVGPQEIPETDTTYACSNPVKISLLGYGGEDDLNLASVSFANGFTMIVQNEVVGGDGGDKVTGSPFSDEIKGGGQNDVLDPGAGPDTVLGEAGSDILQLRDGEGDSADCGPETDAAQTDQQGVDTAANCEILDVAPTPAPSPAPSPAPAPTQTATQATENPACAGLRQRLHKAKGKRSKRKIRRALRALGC
jgi:hypothetical protein